MSNQYNEVETYDVANDKMVVYFKTEDQRISFNQFLNSKAYMQSKSQRNLFVIKAKLCNLEVRPHCMCGDKKWIKNSMYQMLDIAAPKIVFLSELSEKQAAISILSKTGSDYLANRYDKDFSGRYLNSDANNQHLWLRYCGIDSTPDDCEYMRVIMLYFNNNSLEASKLSPQRFQIDLFGNGENWCRFWILLAIIEKDMLLDTILNWKG